MLVGALILPGCGDEQTSAVGTAKGAPTTRADETLGGANAAVAAASHQGAAQCRRAMGDFLDAMESLSNSVAVGVSYDGYLTAVNHVRASYASIQAERLPLLCLARVAAPAERALNAYIETVNTWGDCLATTSCDPESIELELQRRWTQAADGLSRVQANLRNLR